jgi:hypothetical protein
MLRTMILRWLAAEPSPPDILIRQVVREVPVDVIVKIPFEVPVDRVVQVAKEVPGPVKLVELVTEVAGPTKVVEVIREIPTHAPAQVVEVVREVPGPERVVEVVREVPGPERLIPTPQPPTPTREVDAGGLAEDERAALVIIQELDRIYSEGRSPLPNLSGTVDEVWDRLPATIRGPGLVNDKAEFAACLQAFIIAHHRLKGWMSQP